MRFPRRARRFARLVLLGFVLSLSVAVASPLVHPRMIEVLCSSTGAAKAVVHTDAGVEELGASHLDCALCLPAGAPPGVPLNAAPSMPPVSRAVPSIPATRLAAATAAPLPARGPPG
jgi:hypothetical protein